jgi:excinuclease ABC subunit C
MVPVPSEGATGQRVRRGAALIADYVKTLPAKPGVYRMIDMAGEVLYVGKARDLKKRVQTYTRPDRHGARIAGFIAATASMEFVTTRSETEALLLEASLIKRLKPRYNIILRDDKSFPFIFLSGDHEFPQLAKHRGAQRQKGDYFGPFISGLAVNRAIETLERVFLLRTCSDSVFAGRTRPCLLFQIKRCSGPCTGEISATDYAALVADARAFLKGDMKRIRETLMTRMEQAASEQDFETAADYRDRLRALGHIMAHQDLNPSGLEDADIIAAAEEAGQVCIQVFFYRMGQNWGTRAYFPRHDRNASIEEVLAAFIVQFYENKLPPRQILVGHDLSESALIAEALSLSRPHKVAITTPRRGAKKALLLQAGKNAQDALARRLAETSSQAKLLAALTEKFGLKDIPRRIDVFDNSHIQGSEPVGAMIVAGPEGFDKSQYRKFNIRNSAIAPGDDYAMMREVMTRRFARLKREPRESPDDENAIEQNSNFPDLVIIDGGPGQLSTVEAVLAELGIKGVVLLAIAKGPERNAGRERFFMSGRGDFMLEQRSPLLYFLQRLRDEAHRFAIGAHRTRRAKALAASPLDEIEGIGAKRKRSLLVQFGSARAVAGASLAELIAVDGISRAMAQAIYDHFHPDG